ncbi:DNA-binding protein, partial [Micromonospora sp. CPCC 206171]|uniref:DNA-binding protein n=1 Tax=Micromonospora sp. CPCC 206171 TaxID=3122405 RepID=UPI002FEFB640
HPSSEERILTGQESTEPGAVPTNRRDFPEPVAELAMGNVWLAEDVERWIAQKRPELDEA